MDMQLLVMAKESKGRRAPPQSELEQIAARLILSREAQALSPTALCKLAKIATNTYSQWESAIRRPQIDQAKLLRRYLGYTLDWIYEGDRSGLSFKLADKIAEYEAKKDRIESAAKAGTRGKVA